MSCRLLTLLAAITGLIATAGCGRRADARPERIAILRFENTGADPANDWMGRVFSEAVTGALAADYPISTEVIRGYNTTLGSRPGSAPGISAERTQAILAGAGLIGYGRYAVRDGRLQAQLTIQSAQGNRTLKEIAASGPAADPVGVAEALARAWSPKAQAYATRSADSARAYAAAIEAPSPDAALESLERAVSGDAAFAPAQLLLAQTKLSRQDGAGAAAVLSTALEHAAAMTPVWRSRLEFELASLRGDAAGRTRALDALAKASPDDPLVWRVAGDSAMARRDNTAAAAAYRKALAIDPNNLALLNQAGYAMAASGDWKGALENLGHYRALRPQDANPLDSLGDIHLQTGRFADAAGLYEEANKKDPAFLAGQTLYKAAVARLMAGDVAAADALAARFIEARKTAGDPLLEYRKADWSWMSGRRQEGYDRLSAWAASAANGPAREVAARAYAQLAVWSLALGRADAAGQMVSRAAALAGPSSAAIVAVARFLAQPPAASSEWAVRAERAFPNPAHAGIRSFARLYALLLSKDFAAALPLIREMDQAANNSEPALPVLLGWAYLETGKTREAADLLAAWPLPPAEGPAVFGVMYFPRVFYLKGLLAERQGQADAAKQSYRSFLLLSGNQPLAWGEEAAAAAKAK